MRRMCGKSLYQEASAARRIDDGKRVDSAKDKATKIAYPAQSDRRAGEITRSRYLFVVSDPSDHRVLRRLHPQNRSDLSVASAAYVVVLPSVNGQSDLALPENQMRFAPSFLRDRW